MHQKITEKIGEHHLSFIYLHNEKKEAVIDAQKTLEESDIKSALLLKNTRLKHRGESHKITSVCLDEEITTPILKTDGEVDAVALKKLADLIRESKQNYIVIEEGENLCAQPIGITETDRTARINALFSALRSMVVSINTDHNERGVPMLSLIVMTQSEGFYMNGYLHYTISSISGLEITD